MEDVTYEQQLLAAEGLRIAGVDAQHFVDEVDDICPHHRYLVDDDELHLAYQLALGTCVFQRLLDVTLVVARVVGQQGMEGQTEEAVQRRTAGIDGGDTRRCEDDVFLLRVLGNVAQEGALTRAGLSREEKRTTGIVHDLQGVLPLLVVEVEFHKREI